MEKYIPDKRNIFVTEEFLEVVDEFVLTATNESKFYLEVKDWFSYPYNKGLSGGFPVVVGIRALVKVRDKFYGNSYGMTASSSEKRTFVQTMLYLHYVAEFVPEYKHLRITDFYDITRPKPKEYDPFGDPNWVPEQNLLAEAQKHLANAQQHFKHVENEMNTLSKYKDQATTTVDLIHGRPVTDWTEAELIQLVRNARKEQSDLKDMADTSERMKKKFDQLENDIKVYIKALDALPE